MQYPLPDGTTIQSSPLGPVTYTGIAPSSWDDGTYEIYETGSDISGNLEQIKILRVVSNGQMEITVTERTPQEIEEYFKNINN